MSNEHLQIILPHDLLDRLQRAAAFFWQTRQAQQASQGTSREQRDRGARSAVTGGKQMDGFCQLLVDLLRQNGVPPASIFTDQKVEIPGYFRATKKWDLLVVHQGHLLAAMELKSQVGSFGNNCNNRAEEVVGSATDLWTAYRENAFGAFRQPWLGYLFLLEDSPRAWRPVAANEPHFRVFPEFRAASYAQRYEELCRRLVRERLYTEATFLMSGQGEGGEVILREPAADLAFRPFAQSLLLSIKVSLGVLP